MIPTPSSIHQYHVFLASPGDVAVERQAVRRFFEEFNRSMAHIWRARFEVVDWENYATTGVGRPQELVTQQTLDKYRDSLALVVGIMAQRFGSPTGKAESGTEEEFNWAMTSHQANGFPEIKWFFRKVDKLDLPSDPEQEDAVMDQWKKVRAFRKQMQDLNNPVFYAEYPTPEDFADVLRRDLNLWLADPARPWAQLAAQAATTGGKPAPALPIEFDAERYQRALRQRYNTLNFEMLDTTGAYYNAVQLWNVYVEQSVRECHQYNPRLLEIPKEHQRRLLDAGEITAQELEQAAQQDAQLRQDYFQQPRRAVLEVVDEALRTISAGTARKLVVLGDPGSGKSSLVRYLAIRWASLAEPAIRDTQPVPLVVELGAYTRWRCEQKKDFVRYLEEAPGWHHWPCGLLAELIKQPGRALLLLDGLDEVFDTKVRTNVLDDIQSFCNQFPHLPIVVTSRVVGYQAQRLHDAEFRHFMLQDLDAEQITSFLQRWHKDTFDDPAQAIAKCDRLQRAVRESKSIALLAGNPLLLTMMAILNRHQELPRDRADLYAQASRVLLHQWDTERALVDFPDMSTAIGSLEKADLLRRIAAYMQAAPGGLKGNLIDGPMLRTLIEGYLQDELHMNQSRAVARAIVEQLRQRNFILCSVGVDIYAFVHRTFLEYFCAADFVHRFNIAQTLDIDGLIALFDRHCRDDELREVLRLICGQIDESFVGQIVEHLAKKTDLATWDGETPLPELPLAIWCLAEARKMTHLESAGVRLLDTIVECVRKCKDNGGRFLIGQLLPVCKELGERWPGRQMLDKFEKTYLDSVTENYLAAFFWPHLMAFVQGNRKAVMWFVDPDNGTHNHTAHRNAALQALAEKWPDLDAAYRSAALEALAKKWPDQTTRDLLTLCAIQGEDSDTRSAALKALAETWPDQTTRDLLTLRAIQGEAPYTRRTALKALAEKWPDQTTRDLLTRAIQDKDSRTRHTALKALAEKWPDQTSRDLLTLRAVQDEDLFTRRIVLQELAEKWPDQITRDLFTQCAVQDKNSITRYIVLQELAKKWPDQTTRDLLTLRAIQDEDSSTRYTALQVLVEKWPDQTTRDLLTLRAIQDEDSSNRIDMLKALVAKWPDQTTRDLLIKYAVKHEDSSNRIDMLKALVDKWPEMWTSLATRDQLTLCAIQDEDPYTRCTALKALAEKWPDQTTRDLLIKYAVKHEDSSTRSTALEELAERWPDQTTRDLLTLCAIQGEAPYTRRTALKALAEKWPDQTTRDLLIKYAVQQEDSSTRSTALKALAEKWPDQTTRDLLTLRALQDEDPRTRRTALKALAEKWPDQTTRDLLTLRTLQDEDPLTRRTARNTLAEKWTDQDNPIGPCPC